MGFFDKIKQGLTKTRDAISETFNDIFSVSELDDDFYDELEESLILADLGVETAAKAGSNPCPPIIMGVGLGGTIEQAALLSKQALCRSMDKRNSDEFYAELEREALRRMVLDVLLRP